MYVFSSVGLNVRAVDSYDFMSRVFKVDSELAVFHNGSVKLRYLVSARTVWIKIRFPIKVRSSVDGGVYRRTQHYGLVNHFFV